MTNRELITAALRLLSVLDADEAASVEDATLGLDELNNLMTDLAEESIDLGFPPQDSLSDDFPLDDAKAGQIKPILAMYLYTSFPSAKVPPTLPARAERAMSRLQVRAVLDNIEEADLSNLPRGSGSRCGGNILDG